MGQHNSKVYCGGMCEEWKRQNVSCINCKKRLCKTCMRPHKDIVFCPDCFTKFKNGELKRK